MGINAIAAIAETVATELYGDVTSARAAGPHVERGDDERLRPRGRRARGRAEGRTDALAQRLLRRQAARRLHGRPGGPVHQEGRRRLAFFGSPFTFSRTKYIDCHRVLNKQTYTRV